MQLDITVGHQSLADQFDWVLGACQTEPEMFAELLTKELALNAEFRCVAWARSLQRSIPLRRV